MIRKLHSILGLSALLLVVLLAITGAIFIHQSDCGAQPSHRYGHF